MLLFLSVNLVANGYKIRDRRPRIPNLDQCRVSGVVPFVKISEEKTLGSLPVPQSDLVAGF